MADALLEARLGEMPAEIPEKKTTSNIGRFGVREKLEELLSPKELSNLLKVSKPWPYVMVKRGLLPCYKMGKVIRFRVSDIESFLERSRVERRS